jgi:hypothetical protein
VIRAPGKTRLQELAIVLAAAGGAILAMAACSSAERRDRVDAPDAAGASLPEPSVEIEAGAPDATIQRPPFDPDDEPVTCTVTPCAVELVAGENHFCARMQDGTVRCWGDDRKGALGVGDAAGTSDAGASDAGDAGWRAVVVPGLVGTTQLSAGGTTTCAVGGDGGVTCWGGNDKGQLGLDAVTPVVDGERHPAPMPVALPSGAKRVDVGPAGACAVLTNGEIWCWGDNSYEQLARETESTVGVPGRAALGSLSIARTAGGTYSAFALATSGELVSWGAVGGVEGSASGRVASIGSDPFPLSLGLAPVSSFSVSSTRIVNGSYPTPRRGVAHACAIVNGDVFCWGDTLIGALGTGVHEAAELPRRALVASETAWPREVAAAGEITCLRLSDGSVECAGDNALGVLGKDPETTPFSVVFEPVDSLGAQAVRIAAASQTICAIVQGGSVRCWGGNPWNELGQGRNDDDPHPTPVSIAF